MKLVFTYDYMGRRVRKQVYSYSAGAWNSTPTTDRKFVYDGWNLLLELNGLSSDAVLRKYAWGLDLSGQSGSGQSPDGQAVVHGIHATGGIGGLLAMHDAGTSTNHWYFYNANGDIGQLVDSSSGNFSAKYQYYPYGGEIQAVGAYATTNPFRFGTKFWDAEQQAYYYGYRYHKPKLGRWLSRDPLEESDGLNIQAFVRNSPSGLVDPLGLAADEVACCKFAASGVMPGVYYYMKEVFCTPAVLSADTCCRCASDNTVVSSTYGHCCICTIYRARFKPYTWPDHQSTLVVCPGKSKRIDFLFNKQNAIGITFGEEVVVLPFDPVDLPKWTVQEEIKVDCETGQRIIDQANSDAKNPPDYNFIHDCHWYNREMIGIGKCGYRYLE